MKKSNKLLLGLFAVVIICILIVNIVIKKKLDTKLKSDVKIESISSDSTSSVDSDSIAMDKAIENQ